MKRNVLTKICNLCGVRMDGGTDGFIRHGEEHHPNHFLLGADTGDNIQFSEKKYWCPIDGRWHSRLNWLSRNLKKHGWTNERYYQQHGQEHLPDIWAQNTADPVLGDARNHDRCLQCEKPVKFNNTHWRYPAFCGFSCSTSWYATHTDRVQRAQDTLKERMALDATHQLRPTQIDYWTVKHGLTVSEAREKVRERQRTNSLERFIERAGGDVEAGTRAWAERQEKWLASLDARGWFGNHSDVSCRLFAAVQERTGATLRYGADEASIRVGGRVFKPDCVAQGTKKVIEFFGDYWHANPAKFAATDAVRRLDEGVLVTAKEIWDRDNRRLQTLHDHGYNVLVIWEGDFLKDPETVVNQCVSFFGGTSAGKPRDTTASTDDIFQFSS